jgi:hypothetical protein
LRASGLVVLNLRVLRDRRLKDLPAWLDRLEGARRAEGISVTDLAVEGIGIELMRLGEAPLAKPPVSTEEIREAVYRGGLQSRNGELEALLQGSREETKQALHEIAELRRVLTSVEESWSFRLGRLLTAPARRLRSAGRR